MKNFSLKICQLMCFVVLIGFSFQNKLQAQNLVLNYSFEDVSSCPNGISELPKAIDWYTTNTGADSCSSPDLYAACSWQIGGANSPDALLGFQRSKTGDNHAGIILYEPLSPYREYLGGELSTPLVNGQEYCVRFYVSAADEGQFATNSIGVYFSNNQVLKNFCLDNSAPHPLTPQLQYSGSQIVDSVNWVKLEWTYIASGGERYLTIGNFNSNANSNITTFNSNITPHPYAYYFVDDVEVTPTTCCPEVEVASTTPVSCNGLSDGSATVTATGGIPPYSYSWSAGSSSTATNNSLPAGRHTVTVSDSRGCQVPKYVTIKEPDALSVSINQNSNSCGTSLTATPTGGTGPFSYAWSNGASGASIQNVPTGSYTLTVTDNGNCTATASATVTQASSFTINPSSTDNTSCSNCNGTASTIVSGGNPPFSYLWSNGDTTENINGLCSGTYTVTVTEGSSSGGSVFWSEDFTSGGTGWTLNQNGSGTNGADANEWVINNNVTECSNCPATGSLGNYLHITCTSTPCQLGGDVGTCVYEQGVPFFAEAATDKYVSSPNISTIGQSGITLNFWYLSGGESGNDYGLVRLSDDGGTTWTDLPTQYEGVLTCTQASVTIPASYENIADFRIGFRWINDNNTDGEDPPFMIDDIELSATSGSACTATATVTINTTGTGLNANIDSSSNISCFSADDGYISTDVSGSGSYNYNWSSGQSTSSISGLSAGTYTVTIDDGNNCTTTLTETISEPQALSLSANNSGSGCDGNANINAIVSGGTPNYNYNWSNGETSNSITGLSSDTFTLTVTDNNGCSIIDSFIISNNGSFSVTLNATNTTCQGVNNGSVSSNVNGAAPPLSYEWSNGATSSDLQNVGGGTYTVTVTDGNNCTVSNSETVMDLNSIEASAIISDIVCPDDSSGGIKLTPFNGSEPYTAIWSNGSNNISQIDLIPGTYSVTVTDSVGCEFDTSFTINSISNFTIQASSSGLACDETTGATISVNILSGNTGPFTYEWSTGDQTATVENVGAGTYTVEVNDSLNCKKSDTTSVYSSNFLIDEEIIDASCPDEADGAISVTIEGGNPPYAFNWSNGSTDSVLLNLLAGIYDLTVTDDDDCSRTASFEVVVIDNGDGNCDSLMIYDVFSPNGDGRNDLWIIDGLQDYPNNSLQIFSRWGNIVYEISPYENTWDGSNMNGKAMATGTYYYVLKLNDGSDKVYSGHINLIR